LFDPVSGERGTETGERESHAGEAIGVFTSMAEDAKGLAVEGRILTAAGEMERRALAHMREGSVRGLSIGFSIPDGGADYDARSRTRRLKRLDLWEVSLVAVPMQPQARVKAVKEAFSSIPHLERFLCDAGLSRREAKALLARRWAAFDDERDEERDSVPGLQALVDRVKFHVEKMTGAAK
jgi:uncharacterized protein